MRLQTFGRARERTCSALRPGVGPDSFREVFEDKVLNRPQLGIRDKDGTIHYHSGRDITLSVSRKLRGDNRYPRL